MEEHQGLGLIALCTVATVLGLLSSLSCIASEFKRTKVEELKLDGKLCYLPGSGAFKYGVAALVFLCAAQIVGNFGILAASCSRRKKKKMTSRLTDYRRRRIVAAGLLVVSWVSFVIAVTLLTTATSMNREQNYGRGWLNGECYLVKGGVYVGSAVLAFLATGSALGSALSMRGWSNMPVKHDHLEGHEASER